MNEPAELRPCSLTHDWIYKGDVHLATVKKAYAQACLEAIKAADAIRDNPTVLSVENQSHREK